MSNTIFFPAKKPVTLWIIDDNAMDCWIAEKVIRRTNAEVQVLTFKDARQAFQQLSQTVHENKSGKPEFILLDLVMPGMNGWEFIEHYRTLPADFLRDCQLYLYTSSNDRNDKQRVKDIPQVQDLLVKPLSRLDLTERLKITPTEPV
jgi:CheY-like chemotaxis protein